MKALLQLVGIVLIAGLAWYMLRERRSTEFKYNLPELTSTPVAIDSLLPSLYKKSLPRIPLSTADNFSLNTTYQNELANLYAFIFDSLKIEQLPPAQFQHTSLVNLDAATVIQLLAFNDLQVNPTRTKTLNLVALLLNAPGETHYFVQTCLMEDNRWLWMMQTLHRLMMADPTNPALQRAYIAMVTPATADQTIGYLIAVQFLDRGPTDEYYEVNPTILERFETPILKMLLDKVDDYSWYAAYPDRDAEQGIVEILTKRG
ncbi:MAG: hypothetical protein KF856_00045 [Cyclobacteriaceae bacterium]|nr:hypothetical protein [Cyclobacteriaceae bacterium]